MYLCVCKCVCARVSLVFVSLSLCVCVSSRVCVSLVSVSLSLCVCMRARVHVSCVVCGLKVGEGGFLVAADLGSGTSITRVLSGSSEHSKHLIMATVCAFFNSARSSSHARKGD